MSNSTSAPTGLTDDDEEETEDEDEEARVEGCIVVDAVDDTLVPSIDPIDELDGEMPWPLKYSLVFIERKNASVVFTWITWSELMDATLVAAIVFRGTLASNRGQQILTKIGQE